MNYRNRLMILSFIALAVFSACTDVVENGGQRPVKGDHSLSFAVSTPGSQTWTKADGTHAASAPATQELEPVEMEGKVNGKTVYLSAEVTDGFPGENRPMTRGTQVTDDNKAKDGIMETFAVSAYTDITGTADFMYSVPTTMGSPENGTYYWYPEEKFYWPGVKSLNFYAWYPHTANAEGLTVSGADENGTPKLHYTAPNDVKKQMDVMTAVATNQAEQEAIPLTFNHALSAVKFVAGSDLPNCVVKSVKLYNLQYEGTYDIASSSWTEVKPDKKDFIVSWGYNAVEGSEGSPVTREDETFFLVPQTLDGVKVEVTFMNTDNTEFTVGASLSGTWEKGKTYIYKISYNFVYIGVSNEKFVAYVDKTDEMKDQIAFYVNFSSSDPNDTRIIISPKNGGLTVTPKTITPGSNIPIKVSWDGTKNWLYANMAITKSEDDREDKMLMYCVEQKTLTADFGFKDCERNISREAEKWNIVVDATGARLKDEVTKLQARVVISSNIDDTQISDLGRDLTYGDPASIYIDKATMTGISVKPYVKKRWDNGVNDATNNGERTVNVQVKRADSDDWCDIDTKGTMSDRFYWGKNYCIGTDTYYAGETTKNDWNDCATKILTAYWKVHKNHPLFGLYRWTIPRLDTKADVNTNPLYAVHSASKGLNGLNVNSLYGVVGLSPNMLYQGCTKVTSIVDPDNPQSAWNAIYNNDIGTFMVGGKGDWPNNWDASWSDGAHCAQWYPIVYAADYCESSDRPTDELPISGKSVNE
ncbi:fimbrillin family protein [Parabacteroides massiliensis]|uniref:fimbrillin family protein n=1 Tax=Parabacteroides massiliensis TaxID=1750560 RepID=UPI00096A36E2|nr:fimbrillin family protein [Parabacteroides massiliensis]